MIDRQVNHLVRLVDDLLDASRISSGKLELRADVASIFVPVVDRRHRVDPQLAQRKRQRIDVDAGAETPSTSTATRCG